MKQVIPGNNALLIDEAGNVIATKIIAPTDWSNIKNTPTTLSGYGITDGGGGGTLVETHIPLINLAVPQTI